MADNTGGWEEVSNVPPNVQYSLNDAAIQARHPNWPSGGTAAQIAIESGGNNSAVSSAGAIGIAQMEPSTFNAIAKQTGRKLDINNVNDQMFAHRYLMSQNLDRTNGDVTGALNMYNSGRAVADNPETAAYAPKFQAALAKHQGQGAEAPIDYNQPAQAGGWEEVPKDQMPDMDALKKQGWEEVQPGSAAHQRAQGFLNSLDANKTVNAAQGAGEAVGNMMTGGAGMVVGGLHSLLDLATGRSDQATADIARDEEALTYQPRSPEGKAYAQRLGQGFGAVQGAMEQGAVATMGAIPFIGQDLAKNSTAIEVAKIAADIAANIGPMMIGGGEAAKVGKKGPEPKVRVPSIADQLDKIGANEPAGAYEPMGPFPEGGGPLQGQPNAGPQRPINVSAAGVATPAGMEPTFEQLAAEQARRYAEGRAVQMGPNEGPQLPQFRNAPNMGPNAGPQLPSGELFPPSTEGLASPFEPNRLSENVVQPFEQRNPTNLRQMGLPFEQAPEQGTLFGNPEGDIGTAAQMSDVERLQELAAQKEAFDRGDLFGGTGGEASPYNPNRLSSEQQSPFTPNRPTNLRQGVLDFEAPQTPGTLVTDRFGNVASPELMEAARPYRDRMEQHIDDLTRTSPEALDPESPTQHPNEGIPAERAMAPDEFARAVQTLADRDPTKFSVPADMARAYEKYSKIVSGFLDKPSTLAKRFAEAVRDQMREDQVSNHPTIQANERRINGLRDQIESLKASVQPGAQTTVRNLTRQLDNLIKTQETARTNIGKALGTDKNPLLPWEKDGVVNLHTFGHLPTLMKSIGAILKALHGVVFKTLDKVIPKFRNLDSSGKVFAQGIKDFVNKEANREWSQTVNEQPREQLNKIDALRQGIKEYNPYEAQDIGPEQIKQQVMSAPDISGSNSFKAAQNVAQGGLQLTNLTRHPLVKFVTESVDRAMRNARQYTREALTGPDGLRTKMQKLSDDELTGIRTLMELNEGVKEFSDAELRAKGFSDTQREYYKHSRDLDNQAFTRQNNAREAAGLKPMDRRIAHIAGYFMGDFKRVVTDADGKVVAVLANNTKLGLDAISKRYMETHGDAAGHKLGDIKLQKLNESMGAGDNRFNGYMEVLNTLKDTDANVKALVDAYQSYLTGDAQKAMANRAKFKSEVGVIGAEGRKAWQSAKQNAIDGARQQLRYLESVNKWAEMQEAIQKTKGMLTDPEVAKQSPNAVALSQDYLDSVQGRNRGPMQKLTNAIMNGVAEVTGVGPSVFKGMNNITKNVFLKKFVGIFKLSHSAVTLLQPMQALPALNARISARGADLGSASVASVGKAVTSSFNVFQHEAMGKPLSAFEKQAHDFMKANGTADVGMSAHLENVSKGSAKTEALSHVLEANVRIPEQGARTFTYMYYAHMLKDLGLPLKEVFPTAHNLMRDAMVDYSPHERSLMFGKMGVLGDIASTLTRFKYNQIGQHMVGFNDMIKGGSAAPLATTILASIVTGGVRGVFAYEAANQLVDALSTGMAKLGMIKQPTSLNEMVLHAVHGLNHHLADFLNFGATSALGVNMTGSLTNADTIPVDPLGALFPTASEFANLAGAAGTFATHPNRNTASRALLAFAPNSAKGMLEDALFTKNGKYTNPNTGKLEATRTTSDEVKRALSFRPLEEGKAGLVANVANNKQEQLNAVKQTILSHAHSDFVSQGHLTPEQARAYAQRYVELGADPQSFVNDFVQFAGMDQARDRLQRAQGIPSGDYSSAERYLRVEGMK